MGLLAVGSCGINDRLAASNGACGGLPADPGPDECALVCRAVVPLRLVDDAPLVTVWINGRPAELVLDTGAGATTLTAASAARLGLGEPRPAPGNMYGIGGVQARRIVDIRDLALGGVGTGPRAIEVLEYGKLAHPPIGLLGADILQKYEVDLDLPHKTMRLYDGRACPGPPPGWRSAGIAVPFASETHGPQAIVKALVDGVPLLAMIDTGASTSGVSASFARRSGVSEAELASELSTEAFGVGPSSSKGRRHLFRELTIGTETVPAFEADVLDLRLRGLDMLLGVDYLAQRRVWISFARREVRVTSDW